MDNKVFEEIVLSKSGGNRALPRLRSTLAVKGVPGLAKSN